MGTRLGSKRWVIPEGYIPPDDPDKSRARISHEAACLLNTGDGDARVELMIYFANREPIGPYVITVPARRTLHLRFNELTDPEPVPRGTDYSSVLTSSAPVVVQHTRLDSRFAGAGLMSTIAYAAD